jgi:polyhydroxybutyrate depolymerase
MGAKMELIGGLRSMKTFLKWFLGITLSILGFALLLLLTGWIVFRMSDTTNGRIVSSGEERRYLLYIPESYDPSTPVPLVISLHGFAQWPAHQSQLTGWTELADQYGFIVVHPGGIGFPKRWRTELQSDGTPSPDVTFISDLINQLEQDYTIDPNRIYVNGLSNGGGMSSLLACELSDRIAAMGSVAGAYSFSWIECPSVRPVPAIIFHGTADPIVPYMGGLTGDSRFTLPPVPLWVADFARHNGCDSKAVEIPASGEVSGIRHENCSEDAEVIFYTIDGGGHSWPGGGYLPQRLVGHTTQDIDATKVIWEFFQKHPLDAVSD